MGVFAVSGISSSLPFVVQVWAQALSEIELGNVHERK